jgi:hypothetical protein
VGTNKNVKILSSLPSEHSAPADLVTFGTMVGCFDALGSTNREQGIYSYTTSGPASKLAIASRSGLVFMDASSGGQVASVTAGAWTLGSTTSTSTHLMYGSNLTIGTTIDSGQTPQVFTIQHAGATTGTNNPGANLTIKGSASTGSVAGGSIIFQTTPSGSSGASVNAHVTVGQTTAAGAWTLGDTANTAFPGNKIVGRKDGSAVPAGFLGEIVNGTTFVTSVVDSTRVKAAEITLNKGIWLVNMGLGLSRTTNFTGTRSYGEIASATTGGTVYARGDSVDMPTSVADIFFSLSAIITITADSTIIYGNVLAAFSAGSGSSIGQNITGIRIA